MDNDRRKLTGVPATCLWAILLMALPFAGHFATAQEEAPLSRGAVILAEINGPVAFLNENNQSLGDAYTISGMLIPQSTSIRTGVGGSVILLLSNGSLVTIEENTVMRVASFVQEPFDDMGRSLKDLEEEPSSSSVLVDLEIGSLVVKTKKLNKQSNFEIVSPVGTSGIRGTQFGMGFSPKDGMSLDVTESTVSFRPRGGGPAQVVPAGRGLSAPPRGRPVARPINPEARGRINASNNRATRSTSNYSLGYVTSSMKKETREKPPTKSEDRRRKENRQSPGETKPGTTTWTIPGMDETNQVFGYIFGAATPSCSGASKAIRSPSEFVVRVIGTIMPGAIISHVQYPRGVTKLCASAFEPCPPPQSNSAVLEMVLSPGHCAHTD